MTIVATNPPPLPEGSRVFQIATKQGLLQVIAEDFLIDDGCLILSVGGQNIAAFNQADWDTVAEAVKP